MTQEKSAKIIIMGDIGASSENEAAFASGIASRLMDDGLISLLQSADVRIANVEKPLTDTETRLGFCPPDYRALAATAIFFSSVELTVASLANNHILDQKGQVSSRQ